MTIKIHDLRPAAGAKTAKTRVGRGEGGKGGKTAGRGTKGTGARKNVPAGFEGTWEVLEDCTKFYAIFESRT